MVEKDEGQVFSQAFGPELLHMIREKYIGISVCIAGGESC